MSRAASVAARTRGPNSVHVRRAQLLRRHRSLVGDDAEESVALKDGLQATRPAAPCRSPGRTRAGIAGAARVQLWKAVGAEPPARPGGTGERGRTDLRNGGLCGAARL